MRRINSIRACAFGDLSSGKTLTLVIEALRYHKVLFPDFPIFSNIQLNGLKYNKVDSARILFELNDPCFLLLDELWHLADSRKSMALINDVMSQLLLRSSKNGWSVWYSQQWFTQTDIRIRFITSLWVQPQLLENDVLQQDFLNKHGEFIQTRYINAVPFYDRFESTADPFTLNLDELKELWLKQRRKLGFSS